MGSCFKAALFGMFALIIFAGMPYAASSSNIAVPGNNSLYSPVVTLLAPPDGYRSLNFTVNISYSVACNSPSNACRCGMNYRNYPGNLQPVGNGIHNGQVGFPPDMAGLVNWSITCQNENFTTTTPSRNLWIVQLKPKTNVTAYPIQNEMSGLAVPVGIVSPISIVFTLLLLVLIYMLRVEAKRLQKKR